MTDTIPASRPMPIPYRSAEPYWAAAQDGRLVVQRCDQGHLQFYPRPHCHDCGSRTLSWVEVSGKATVHTFSVVHRAAHEGFAQRAPYVFAIVDLAEGPRMTANIVDVDADDVQVDMPVRAVFTDHDGEHVLPQFAPHRDGDDNA